MPKVSLTHFEAALLFAFFTSIVFGVVGKRTDRERFYYALYCFAWFIVALFGIGWVMFLAHK